MRYYLSLTILGIGIHGWAQQISPSVTATSGNTLQNGSVALDFTIGEPITNSFQNGPVLLTQGFHQPVISLADISEWEEANIQLFPNPSTNEVSLQIPVNSYQQLRIFDEQGKLVYENDYLKEINVLDVRSWATGKYNLVLIGTETKQLSFIKLDSEL